MSRLNTIDEKKEKALSLIEYMKNAISIIEKRIENIYTNKKAQEEAGCIYKMSQKDAKIFFSELKEPWIKTKTELNYVTNNFILKDFQVPVMKKYLELSVLFLKALEIYEEFANEIKPIYIEMKDISQRIEETKYKINQYDIGCSNVATDRERIRRNEYNCKYREYKQNMEHLKSIAREPKYDC